MCLLGGVAISRSPNKVYQESAKMQESGSRCFCDIFLETVIGKMFKALPPPSGSVSALACAEGLIDKYI